jgi:hypothetical protein
MELPEETTTNLPRLWCQIWSKTADRVVNYRPRPDKPSDLEIGRHGIHTGITNVY